jgi:hypothetical protein
VKRGARRATAKIQMMIHSKMKEWLAWMVFSSIVRLEEFIDRAELANLQLSRHH